MWRVILCMLVFWVNHLGNATINFRRNSSTFQISDGTALILDQKIPSCQGTIIKEGSGTFSGQNIIFDNGIFNDRGNQFGISGTLKPGVVEQVLLTGNQTFRGINGSSQQSIIVSGNNNRLEGDVLLRNDLVLQDANASLTCALLRRLGQNIQLNGGTLFFEENLGFVDDKRIVGTGKVSCNGRRLILGAQENTWDNPLYFDGGNDIVLNAALHLAQTWTFSGANNTIFGNGNVIFLESLGKLVVERGSTLTLHDVVLRNVSGSNVFCQDNAGTIILQDVGWVQTGNFNFNKGSLQVIGFLDMVGSYTFAFQSVVSSTVNANSIVYLEPRFTFSYDPLVPRNYLLSFIDNTSVLYANNANIYITRQGLQLTKGRIVVDGIVDVFAERKIVQSGGSNPQIGLIVGNDAINNDFICEISPGATLEINNGIFIYKNTSSLSWKARNALSTLQMDPRTTLQLDEDFYLQDGRLLISTVASLLKANGKNVIGSVSLF